MDALETKQHVEHYGGRCLLIVGDIGYEPVCQKIIAETICAFGKLDVLVNNAAEMKVHQSLEQISAEQIERTFRTNIFSYLFLTKAALPHLTQGSSIINTASIVAYVGYPTLIEYSATKGAVVSFTRALSLSLVGRGIRVNGVAPGPIWTPLIPSSHWAYEEIPYYGQPTPMRRAGQPVELAPAYVYLASEDSSYMTGQVMHVNGGMQVGG
jgi:NAD(P)-dependent dehydrogenase (short-subunit alcohol dehydrogenase family)